MGRLLLVILGLSVLFVAGAATTLLYLRIAQHPAAAPQNLAEGAKPKPSAVLAPPPAPPVSLLVQAQPAAAGTATRAPLSAAQPRAVPRSGRKQCPRLSLRATSCRFPLRRNRGTIRGAIPSCCRAWPTRRLARTPPTISITTCCPSWRRRSFAIRRASRSRSS